MNEDNGKIWEAYGMILHCNLDRLRRERLGITPVDFLTMAGIEKNAQKWLQPASSPTRYLATRRIDTSPQHGRIGRCDKWLYPGRKAGVFWKNSMKNWKFWLGVLISIVFMWLALRGLRLGDMWEALKEANYWWLLPGVGVYFMGVWARAWRWHYLLRPVKPISTRRMFPIVAIGYMGNNIYPARAGEVLRAVVLRNHEQVPISASLATIIVERLFDGVVMLAFVFINLPRLAQLTGDSGFVGSIQNVAIWGTVIFTIALVSFLLAAMFPAPAAKLSTWLITNLLPNKLQKSTLGIAGKFLEGLASLRSPGSALMVFLTSIVIWLFETGKYWFVMHAFPFKVDFFTLMLMNGIVNLATTIPSAPGYIGTFDAPGIAVLKAAGVKASIAAGYTLVLHAALWLPITLLGAYYLAKEGIKWGEDVEKLGKSVDKK